MNQQDKAAAYTRYSGRTNRRRRQAKRGKIHWGRLIALVVVLLIIVLVAGFVGTLVALSRNLPNLDKANSSLRAQTTFIYDRHGHPIAELHGATNRIVVTSNQIPQAMKDATVAIEDRRFYQHHGIDFEGIIRAALADLKAGHVVEGASTITEQYVKNAYVGDEQSLTRKIREAMLAWELENKWTKDQILTHYLNAVYYGAGAYGVQAAAQTYFHKNVWQLNLAQCALLAGLPKFPSQYSPISDPEVVKARRNLVLDEMARSGYITQARADKAKASKLGVYKQPPASNKGPAAYFIDYVTRQLIAKYGAREVFEGGLRVYTSIDMKMQQSAIDALKSTLPSGPAGAMVSIDPPTGYIRAMVASTDWNKTKFNLAWQARRQPGSAMKPFALVAAVEEGANPATTYYISRPLHIAMPGANPPVWDVSTFGHTYAGRINLVQATLASDNTVYAQLALDLGADKIVEVAHRMGITSPLPAVPSIVLGSNVVNPLEMADAYATLASGGVRHRPQAIERVVFPDHHVEKTKITGTRVLSQGVAYVVDKILEQNTYSGTGAGMRAYYSGVAAGKTGTTTNSADAWFCGFNPLLATAIWMGYPQAEIPMPGVQGATYCVPIFGKFYQAVFGGQSVPDFTQPAVMPLFHAWKGKYSLMSPSPSPSPSPSGSKSPKPKPTVTYTIKPTASPTPSSSPAPTPSKTPKPTPSPTKP